MIFFIIKIFFLIDSSFSHGVTLTGPLMLTYDFLNEIAPKLARFHCIKFDMPEIKFKTHHEVCIDFTP